MLKKVTTGKVATLCAVGLMVILVVALVFLAQDIGGNESGELHCTVGAIGIALVLLSLAAGFLWSSRFGRIKAWNPRLVHYSVTVITAVYLTGVFILGLMKLGWTLVVNYHLFLGVSIPLVAWLAVLLSPCLSGNLIKWKTSSKIHAVLGFLLLLLVITQVLYAYLFIEG